MRPHNKNNKRKEGEKERAREREGEMGGGGCQGRERDVKNFCTRFAVKVGATFTHYNDKICKTCALNFLHFIFVFHDSTNTP